MRTYNLLASFLSYLIPRIIPVLLAAALIGCSTTPEFKPQIQTQQPDVVQYALSLQGIPYRYGKETPEEGFDCSGFVKHVYGRYGILLPRSASAMATVLPPISPGEIRSGDLLFFNTSGKTYSHVGIFIDDDKFIHAPSQRTGRVLVSSMNNSYWQKRFVGARRPGLH
jgi:cell wall-associated NlpC family hydrolase